MGIYTGIVLLYKNCYYVFVVMLLKLKTEINNVFSIFIFFNPCVCKKILRNEPCQ